jgi:hypothetical protein
MKLCLYGVFTCDLGIQRAAVARLLNAKYTLDPRDYLVAGGVGRLVEVDDAGAEVGFDIAFERSASRRNRDEVTGSDQD